MSHSGSFNDRHQLQGQRPKGQDSPKSPHKPSNSSNNSKNPFLSSAAYIDNLPASIPIPQLPRRNYTKLRHVPSQEPFDYKYTMNQSAPSTPSQQNSSVFASPESSQWAGPSKASASVSPPPPLPSQPQPIPMTPQRHFLHSSPSSPQVIENSKHSPASKYEPQRASRPLSPADMAELRKQSFAVNQAHDVIDLDTMPNVDPNTFKTLSTVVAIDEASEPSSANKEQHMKRHRVATQRHAKGRPNTQPKRSKSIFTKRANRDQEQSPSASQKLASTEKPSITDDNEGLHKVFFNMPLPEDMLDADSGLPNVSYPRNKVRTTKYTPLSFIPKNLYFQFRNVANVYFLFIVILGVSLNPALYHF